MPEENAPETTTEEPTGEPLPAGLAEALGAGLVEGRVEAGVIWLNVKPDALPATLETLRAWQPVGYNQLSDICGSDLGDRLQVVYHLFQLMADRAAVVKIDLPREGAKAPTATHLWKMAEWAERETGEMFGIEFVGHPEQRNLLLPDDWEGYPLRKDYEYPMDHPYLRPDPLREDPRAVLEPAPPTPEPEAPTGEEPAA